MEHPTTIVEMCPQCGSVDVLVAEPRWFAIDVDRRGLLGTDDSTDLLDFGCRDCGIRWH